MFSKIFRRSKPDRSENASGSNGGKSNADGGKNSKKKTRKENSNPAIEKLSTLENSWRWSRADAATNVILNKALVVEDQIVRRMDDLKKSNNHRNAAVVGTVPMVVDGSVRADPHHASDATRENSVEFPSYRKEKSSRNEFVDVTRDGRVAVASSSSYRNSSNRKQNDQLRSESNPNDNATANRRELHLLLQQESPPLSSRNASIPISDQTASNSFNPINKSRAFFYEIMGKNRNRNRNRNRNKDTKPYERVDSSITTVATVAAANVCVKPPGQDQSNVLKSNELKSNENRQLEECTKLTTSAVNNDRESNINKFLEDKNNFENFGYQITKSKNRQNLVMNYEGEVRQDEGIEDDVDNEWQNFPKIGGSGSQNVLEESAPPVVVVCADASLDANRNFKHEADSQSNTNGYNNVGSSNGGNNEVIVNGDLNLYGEQIGTDPHRNESNYSRQSDDYPPHGPLDCDVVPVAATTAQFIAGHSTTTLQRNFENDRLQIDDLDADADEEQLSELTECDRDRRQDQILIDAINMGQDSSKNSAAGRHTNQSWRPSDHVQSANIVIPTITVADYSDDSFKATDKTPNNSPGNATLDNDIFYDTENFDSDPSGSAGAAANIPSGCWGGLTVDSAVDNDNNFVACESDDVIIEDDPDFIADIPTTVINSARIPRDDSGIDYRSGSGRGTFFSDNFRNTSNSSIFNENGSGNRRSSSNGSIRASASSSSASSGDSCGKHHTDSPDSGIELLDDNSRNYTSITSEHLLHTAGAVGGGDSENFVRGGSTDCDESFMFPSDNEDPEQLHHHQTRQHRQEYQQYHLQHDNDHNRSIYENPYSKDKAILIDSISLPDVVVESTSGMGNSQSIKTVEHIEDHKNATIILTDHNDNNTRDLVNQEARYSAQLEEAQKIIFSTQAKVNELQSKIDSLEQELSIKSWNVDRLQGELQAANTEDACVRSRLTILQEEIVNIKQKYSESEYELSCRYEELQTKHKELLENYRHTQNFANALQSQLAFANSDIENLRLEKQKLSDEKDEELRKLQEALRKSEEKHKELEEKWHKEFETLRTQNADREEHLMADCEWQLRAMQKTCKDKIDFAVREKNKALEQANEISNRASEQLEQVTHLIPLEAEIKQLRGLTSEQNESLISMSDQMENLRSDLEVANQQLEEEIKNVRKIRMHCENSLSDKDRQMVQKIEEARGDVAVEWERRLMEEMSRLKHELELVHADDRRDALDKLQIEHIEEIKALTCRFDANEEELRIEVAQLRAALQEKTDILNEIEERSRAKLLETRMHLERADSEYQIAMNRQNDMREELMEQLQSEFAQERTEMEEKFRERLNQVKDEFAKELANTTDELKKQHRKQLGKQPLSLTYANKQLWKNGSYLSSEKQWEKLIAEKEDALQIMETRHRIRHEEAENRIKELEIEHHRDMKEMKTNFEIERTTLESRDLQNSQEIEQLHRKCRCLTNLFEEMRMRYERREPRPEDLREIAELRERCESQERDLHALTERLREIQIERENEIVALQDQRKSKVVTPVAAVTRKPPSKTIPTNCDVIYEENEERESPHKENNGIINTIKDEDDDNDDDDDENGEDSAGNDSDEDEEEDDEDDEDKNDDDRSEESDRPDFQRCKRFEINEAIAAES